MIYLFALAVVEYQSGKVVMGDDLTLRLPPLLLVKLERGAAHLEMSRNAYITSILRRALEGGRPIIIRSDFDDEFSQGVDVEPSHSKDAGVDKLT